jgi:hypothetical protein
LFFQRCISCHNNNDHGNGKLCKMSASLGSAITANCIDCHMPAKPCQRGLLSAHILSVSTRRKQKSLWIRRKLLAISYKLLSLSHNPSDRMLFN